jgi:hypothetical protein
MVVKGRQVLSFRSSGSATLTIPPAAIFRDAAARPLKKTSIPAQLCYALGDEFDRRARAAWSTAARPRFR